MRPRIRYALHLPAYLHLYFRIHSILDYQKTRKQLFARRLNGLYTGRAAAESAAENGQAAHRAYADADGEVVTGAGDAVRDEL